MAKRGNVTAEAGTNPKRDGASRQLMLQLPWFSSVKKRGGERKRKSTLLSVAKGFVVSACEAHDHCGAA